MKGPGGFPRGLLFLGLISSFPHQSRISRWPPVTRGEGVPWALAGWDQYGSSERRQRIFCSEALLEANQPDSRYGRAGVSRLRPGKGAPEVESDLISVEAKRSGLSSRK